MMETRPDEMRSLLERQRRAFLAARPESLAVRQDRLSRLLGLLVDHGEALSRAMAEDFGHRSTQQGMLADILPAISLIKYCKARLKRWARPDRRGVLFPLGLLGARAEVRYEPKGVIGIVSPWNFPVLLTMAPLAQALSAGNRALIKPSEFTPATSALMQRLISELFTPEEIAVCPGGADAGQAFCSLPFDHLLFTGATGIGRAVLRAAAENLVPVTLELGGKSPVVIGRSARLERTAERIVIGKMLNAGQICLAPDYLLVPAEQEDAIVAAIAAAAARMYPSLLANDDYGGIINQRHHQRLTALVDDAVAKGAAATVINPAGEDFRGSNQFKLPLTLLTGVDGSMQVMHEEIFGPVLPVLRYDRIGQAIDHINARDHPLGLYYFGEDAAEAEAVLSQTASGGAAINEVVLHASMDDLPFGGIGASGMGAYHGPEGFRTFSHARTVFRQSKLDVAGLAGLKPPYGKMLARVLKMQIRR